MADGGATQTLNAPTVADPALNPTPSPITVDNATAAPAPVTASDLNPPPTPAALASNPAYLAYLRTFQNQKALNANQASEQTGILKANLGQNLDEIARRGQQATVATRNAYSQRGTLGSSWAQDALGVDAMNAAQGQQNAISQEAAGEKTLQQNLAQSTAGINEALSTQALNTGVNLLSNPQTAGQTANAAATPQLIGPAGQATGASTTGQSLVAEANKYVGGPYVWGGGHAGTVGPGGAVDCSGLVQQVMADNGITFTGTAADMQHNATPVANIASAQPGDLVFYGSPAYHVGIYIGNGQMISAEDPADGVKVASVGTPTSIGRVQGTGGAGAGPLITGGGASAAFTTPSIDLTPTNQTLTNPAIPAQAGAPAQPEQQTQFQVPAALASSPAWLAYMRTIQSNENNAGSAEEQKISDIGASLTQQVAQNQSQLPFELAGARNTQSQRGTLGSSWAQYGLQNTIADNAFRSIQARQAALSQESALRQALQQSYVGDQQKLVGQALTLGQQLGSNPGTAGTAANAATTPSGTIPTDAANIKTPQDFAAALLSTLGAPNTAANVASIVNWARREGGNWQNTANANPLNTTQTATGSHPMNSVGVQSYPDWNTGLLATAATLRNGRYSDIVQALMSGGGLGNGSYAGLRTWSGGGYSSI